MTNKGKHEKGTKIILSHISRISWFQMLSSAFLFISSLIFSKQSLAYQSACCAQADAVFVDSSITEHFMI
jgi:hypothetical protein